MKMVCKRVGGALVPDGDESWDVLNKIVQHHRVVVSIHKSRNPDGLRRYWALCSAVADADPGFDDREDADHYARCSIPWMRKEYVAENGRVTVRPRSIAMDEMGEGDFDKFYARAVEVFSQRIGMDAAQLMKEAAQRADKRRAPGGNAC
jgi:hypothetical protein